MEEINCGWCKKPVKKYRSQIKKYKNHFCSRDCKYQWNTTLEGYWKGKSMSMQARLNMSQNHADVKGSKNPRWKGGKRVEKDGYILIWKPEHPHSDYHGYVREHRLVVEQKIGRYLQPEEAVHHIDYDKKNNKIENLKLLKNWGEHQKLHYREGSGATKHLKHSPAWKSKNPSSA